MKLSSRSTWSFTRSMGKFATIRSTTPLYACVFFVPHSDSVLAVCSTSPQSPPLPPLWCLRVRFGGAGYQFVCLVYVSESYVPSVTEVPQTLLCEKKTSYCAFQCASLFFCTQDHDTPYWQTGLAEICQGSFAEPRPSVVNLLREEREKKDGWYRQSS